MEYPIETRTLTGIEHPYIIHDTSKAIRSLGGSQQLADVVSSDKDDCQARLYNRPGDPLSVPVSSENVRTTDFLLAVTVPKIAGRKRKKVAIPALLDTADPSLDSNSHEVATEAEHEGMESMEPTKRLRRSLQDRPEQADVEVIGTVARTHRFRELPDFGFATSTGSFVKQFQEKLVPFDYDRMVNFRLDLSNSNESSTELLPPPRLSPFTIPFNYQYRQNPSIRQVLHPSGEVEFLNEAKGQHTYTPRISFDATEVPSNPPAQAPPVDSVDDVTRGLVHEMQRLFESRPIWTRRALFNQIENEKWRGAVFKQAYQYVSYMFRSGPWREAFIKLGLDPRKDPELRVYQTIFFQLERDKPSNGRATDSKPAARGGARRRGISRMVVYGAKELGRKSHIFDGNRVALDGKVWQVCDLTDPQLASILATENIRRKCHVKTDGWYHNGTWARARGLAKLKMLSLIQTEVLDTTQMDQITLMPDVMDEATWSHMVGDRRATKDYNLVLEQLRGRLSTPEPRGEVPALGDVPIHHASLMNDDVRIKEAVSAFHATSAANPYLDSPDEDSQEEDDDEFDSFDEDEDDGVDAEEYGATVEET